MREQDSLFRTRSVGAMAALLAGVCAGVWLVGGNAAPAAGPSSGTGAKPPHWAFVKPVRPEPPAVKDPGWPKNAIDHFILARLEKEGLRPSPEADRAVLIRR